MFVGIDNARAVPGLTIIQTESGFGSVQSFHAIARRSTSEHAYCYFAVLASLQTPSLTPRPASGALLCGLHK